MFGSRILRQALCTESDVRIAYRRLLKVQQLRFKDDERIIAAAREQTRKEFDTNKELSEPEAINKRLKHARQVEEVIRRYVVQAPRSTEKDNTYKIKFTSDHALRDRHPIIVKSSLKKKTDEDK